MSYLIDGKFRHEDFVGHEGVLEAGDLQVGQRPKKNTKVTLKSHQNLVSIYP